MFPYFRGRRNQLRDHEKYLFPFYTEQPVGDRVYTMPGIRWPASAYQQNKIDEGQYSVHDRIPDQ